MAVRKDQSREDYSVLCTIYADSDLREIVNLQIDLWELLADLWGDSELDPVSRSTCFRRHNFPSILLETLIGLENVLVEERTLALAAINSALKRILNGHAAQVKLRPTMEQAVLIFGACLRVVNDIYASSASVGNELIELMSGVYSSILHDVKSAKKVTPRALFLKLACKTVF
jgi:hypothetical protein